MSTHLLQSLRRPSALGRSSERKPATEPAKDRVLFLRGLFKPPKPSAVQAKQAEPELRSISIVGLLLGFAFIMTLIGVVGDYGLLSTSDLKDHERQLRQDIQQMQQQEQELLAEVQALRSSQEYLDFLARRDLGLVKVDELVYYLPKELELPRESSYLVFPSSHQPDRPVERLLEPPPLREPPPAEERLSINNTNSALNGEASH